MPFYSIEIDHKNAVLKFNDFMLPVFEVRNDTIITLGNKNRPDLFIVSY